MASPFEALDGVFIESRKDLFFAEKTYSPLDTSLNFGEKLKRKFVEWYGFTDSAIKDYNARMKQIIKLVNMSSIPFNKGTSLQFSDTFFTSPKVSVGNGERKKPMTPAYARTNSLTYSCEISTTISEVDDQTGDVVLGRDGKPNVEPVFLMNMPIMLGSEQDTISGLTEDERFLQGEEKGDPGGYFIISGLEYVIVLFENMRLDRFRLSESHRQGSTHLTSSVSMLSDNIHGPRMTEIFSVSKNDIIFFKVPFLGYQAQTGSDIQFELFDVYRFFDQERFAQASDIVAQILSFVRSDHRKLAGRYLQNNVLRDAGKKVSSRDSIIKSVAEIKGHFLIDDIVAIFNEDHIRAKYIRKANTFLKDPSKGLKKIKNDLFRGRIAELLELDFGELYQSAIEDDATVFGDQKPSDELINELRQFFFGYLVEVNRSLFAGSRIANSKVPRIYTYDQAYEAYFEEFSNNFFPKTTSVSEKLAMVSLTASRLLLLRAGILKPDDKNNWGNVKLKTPGELLFKTFSKCFRSYKTKLADKVEEERFALSQDDRSELIFEDILPKNKEAKFVDKIINNFAMNNWSGQAGKKDGENKGTQSRLLKRDNFTDFITHLTMTTTTAGDNGGNIEAKQLHNSEIMYICPAHTPEGENCGRVKHIAATARYTYERDNTDTISEILSSAIGLTEPSQSLTHPDQVELEDGSIVWSNHQILEPWLELNQQSFEKVDGTIVLSEPLTSGFLAEESPVFSTPFLFNGVFKGYVQGLYAKKLLRQAKRRGILPRDCCIVYDPEENLCSLDTSSGRLVRPLLVVNPETNVPVYEELGLTDQNSFDEFIESGAIEMVDVYEQNYSYIARDRNDLRHKDAQLEQIQKELDLLKDGESIYLVQKDGIKYYLDQDQLDDLEKEFEKEKEKTTSGLRKEILSRVESYIEHESRFAYNRLITSDLELSLEERLSNLEQVNVSAEEVVQSLLESLKEMSGPDALDSLKKSKLFKDAIRTNVIRLGQKEENQIDVLDLAATKLEQKEQNLTEKKAELEAQSKEYFQAEAQANPQTSEEFLETEILRSRLRQVETDLKSVTLELTDFENDEEYERMALRESEKIASSIVSQNDEIQRQTVEVVSLLRSSLVSYKMEEGQKLDSRQISASGSSTIVDQLKYQREQIRKRTTHEYLEIDPNAMFGISANAGSYLHMNMGPRIVYQTSHASSSVGVHHGNQRDRMEPSKSLSAPVAPIVSSAFASYSGQDKIGAGYPVLVMYANMGFNDEDAIIVNRAAIERGLFHIEKRIVFKDSLGGSRTVDEKFGIPPVGSRRKNDKIYRLIDPETGIIRERTDYLELQRSDSAASMIAKRKVYISRGDCIIAKYRTINEAGEIRVVDMSTYAKEGEEGWVERVYSSASTVKVKVVTFKIPESGDKFTTLHAQKGVIGMVLAPEDLPFSTVTGQAPDIIVNSLGIPSRMTIGQITEFMVGKAAAIEFQRANSTSFRKYEMDTVHEALKGAGFNSNGTEVVYDGMTGRKIEVAAYTGIAYFRPLKHMVSDKIQARSFGPVERNRQPVRGKNNGGGIRVSTNKRSVITAHGAMNVLKDRMSTSSDAVMLDFCECNFTMETIGREKVCPVCEGGGKYAGYAPVPFVTKILQAYALASGFKLGLKIKRKDDAMKLMEKAGIDVLESLPEEKEDEEEDELMEEEEDLLEGEEEDELMEEEGEEEDELMEEEGEEEDELMEEEDD